LRSSLLNVGFWHDSDVEGWAEHVRSAQVFQTSTCSAIARGIVNLDPEIADGALNLGVTEEQLHRPEVAGPAIDQSSFCPAQGVGAEDSRVQSDACCPTCE
jgi:hypothetical protein